MGVSLQRQTRHRHCAWWVWYCIVLYCIVWYCIVLYCIYWHSMVWYCIIWYCTVLWAFAETHFEVFLNVGIYLNLLAWCGMVLYRILWYAMLWYDMLWWIIYVVIYKLSPVVSCIQKNQHISSDRLYCVWIAFDWQTIPYHTKPHNLYHTIHS